LGTQKMKQAKPLGYQNYPDVAPDLNARQLASLVSFVDTLPRPIEARPSSAGEAAKAEHGKRLFNEIGCAVCHAPDLGSVKGLYSDLLLHKVEDDQRIARGVASYYNPEPPPPEPDPRSVDPLPNEWRTPPLWGCADSAPYFHDGGAATLEAAILRHAGTAKPVAKAFRELARADQDAVVAFLATLRAPQAPTVQAHGVVFATIK
jgi:CxxC motif-containing protein (DUF1111 family)